MTADDQGRVSQQDYDALRRKYQDLLLETETMKAKVICLQTEKDEAVLQWKKSRDIINGHRKELLGLQDHLLMKKELESQVENNKKHIVELQGDLDRLRDLLKETENERERIRVQYQDSLDLVEKLTANNVDLKVKVSTFGSELDTLKESHKNLEDLYSKIVVDKESLSIELAQLRLSKETVEDTNRYEIQQKELILQERDEEVAKLKSVIVELENDKKSLIRNFNASIKDLKKQLRSTSKSGNRCEDGKSEADSDRISAKSRTSSCASLEIPSPTTSVVFNANANGYHAQSPRDERPAHQQDNGYADADIDKTALIEKIIRLQRELVRKSEKCDFLEDHVALLTMELKRRPK